MLLEESIETGKVVITELTDGGSVPELKVLNGLEKDVLILDGEALEGAKQNRIVNTTIIIGKGKEVVIPVSCVEQGRWSYRTRHFSSSASHLYADLRKKKARSVHRNLKMSGSYASDQSEIWQNIRAKHASFSVHSETDSMNDIYTSYDEQMKQYETAFKPVDGQIGLVSMVNDKIAGLDILGVSSVFPKIYAKLLKSYVLDALEQSRVSEKRADQGVSPESDETEGKKSAQDKATEPRENGAELIEEVKEFLKQVNLSKKESFKSVGEGNDLRFESRSLNGFALVNEKEVIHMAAFAD